MATVLISMALYQRHWQCKCTGFNFEAVSYVPVQSSEQSSPFCHSISLQHLLHRVLGMNLLLSDPPSEQRMGILRDVCHMVEV